MPLQPPLGVRLTNPDVPSGSHVDHELRDLSFRSSIPGGFEYADAALDRPLRVAARELQQFTDFLVYDKRTLETVWQGELDDPGRAASSAGEVYTLRARGPAQTTDDKTFAVIYTDRMTDRIVRSNSSRKSMTTEAEGDGIKIMALRGDGTGSTSFAQMDANQFIDIGQQVARIEHSWDSGVTDTDWRVFVSSAPSGSTISNVASNTAGGAYTGYNVVVGDTRPQYRFARQNTAQTIANDATWLIFANMKFIGRRYNWDGTLNTAAHSGTVVAADVIRDVIGRALGNVVDLGWSTIAATAVSIDQLAYTDGTTARRVLTELMAIEPDSRWAMWEKRASGKYRFVWDYWPTSTIRYIVREYDEFDGPSSAADLWDSVLVRYKQPSGRIAYAVRTKTVAVLTDSNRNRQAFLDISDEVGSAGLANAVGDAFLNDHNAAPNTGRLAVSTPVWDRQTGRVVDPWLLRPGALIAVPGILPRPDRLNKAGRDGQTVFRFVGHDYTASTNRASLELDNSPVATSEQVAALRRRFEQRRRR